MSRESMQLISALMANFR